MSLVNTHERMHPRNDHVVNYYPETHLQMLNRSQLRKGSEKF